MIRPFCLVTFFCLDVYLLLVIIIVFVSGGLYLIFVNLFFSLLYIVSISFYLSVVLLYALAGCYYIETYPKNRIEMYPWKLILNIVLFPWIRFYSNI